MMRIVFFFLLFGSVFASTAQHIMPPPSKPLKIAVLAPLYLDSLFQNGELKNEKAIPVYARAGLDFIQGAQIAFDTLTANQKLEVSILDTKSASRPIQRMIQNGELENFDLIIGSIRPPEFTPLSDFARTHRVPVVSATYPNDAGVTDNPYLIIVNSTLRAHIEAIYSYLLQKHGGSNIYLMKEKGDDRIDQYFKALNTTSGTPSLQIKRITADTGITTNVLRKQLDTSKTVVVVGASLQQDFALAVAKALYPIAQNNNLVYLGMPNWSDFSSLKQNELTDFPIRYTAAVYPSDGNAYIRFLRNRYFDLYRTTPSEAAQIGFETACFFTDLLLKHGKDFMARISGPSQNKWFDYHFAEVNKTNDDDIGDYYENKHVYFLRIINGKVFRD